MPPSVQRDQHVKPSKDDSESRPIKKPQRPIQAAAVSIFHRMIPP
ncbi:hypothetical protein RMSM_01434 [Rhodopirellula maiorica SM1]|uniref:Uncharacterized protein n=1 Tax=Rhodopirellula maiorica SM1 TaxID=1265738 RepID=M5RQR2_9BACT|nr:hypothetical protein RMSM_01434 [Rhodopirellula maiorica SM1]